MSHSNESRGQNTRQFGHIVVGVDNRCTVKQPPLGEHRDFLGAVGLFVFNDVKNGFALLTRSGARRTVAGVSVGANRCSYSTLRD